MLAIRRSLSPSTGLGSTRIESIAVLRFAEQKAQPAVLSEPLNVVCSPGIVEEIAVHAMAQIGILLREVQWGSFSECNDRSVDCVDEECAVA